MKAWHSSYFVSYQNKNILFCIIPVKNQYFIHLITSILCYDNIIIFQYFYRIFDF